MRLVTVTKPFGTFISLQWGAVRQDTHLYFNFSGWLPPEQLLPIRRHLRTGFCHPDIYICNPTTYSERWIRSDLHFNQVQLGLLRPGCLVLSSVLTVSCTFLVYTYGRMNWRRKRRLVSATFSRHAILQFRASSKVSPPKVVWLWGRDLSSMGRLLSFASPSQLAPTYNASSLQIL